MTAVTSVLLLSRSAAYRTLRILAAALSVMLLSAYLTVVEGAPQLLGALAAMSVQIGVMVLCILMLVAALRNMLEPALWGIGYAAGLATFMVAGQMSGDLNLAGQIYTGCALIIVIAMSLVWLEKRTSS